MSFSTALAYCSRSLMSARSLPIRTARASVPRRTQTRFFSEQSTSPNTKGNETADVRDFSNGAEGNAGGKESKSRSPHAQWYTDTVPAMIPIVLLGSAVYIGLQLVRTKLATEKYLDEANERIAQLEEEIQRLQSEQEARNSVASGGPEGASGAKKEPSRWWWFA